MKWIIALIVSFALYALRNDVIEAMAGAGTSPMGTFAISAIALVFTFAVILAITKS